jgi:hypothetical protein
MFRNYPPIGWRVHLGPFIHNLLDNPDVVFDGDQIHREKFPEFPQEIEDVFENPF